MSEAIKTGLRQMGLEGVTRLKEWIEDGKEVLLDGSITKIKGDKILM